MLKRIAFTSGLILLAANLSAGEMYMWVDSEGVRHFSDRPPQRGEKAKVKGEVTTDVLRVDRRPPKSPVKVRNNLENTGGSLPAPTQASNEIEAENSQTQTQSNTDPVEDGQ
ncbi:DUF4124 domain-containing protein [Neptuniibacter sp. PT34_22]|uniref:DUF4124 domain-containing protein n=1 Tax=Neptuniibacter sp. PT34_22 TaxID=3398205 RepID=UPI0039F4F186